MILYNVTVSLDPQVEHRWIDWMKNSHIPDMMKTGCFTSHRFLKLINDQPDVEGPTYAIQYMAETMEAVNEYIDKHAAKLRKEHSDKFPNQFATFRTLLEEV